MTINYIKQRSSEATRKWSAGHVPEVGRRDMHRLVTKIWHRFQRISECEQVYCQFLNNIPLFMNMFL